MRLADLLPYAGSLALGLLLGFEREKSQHVVAPLAAGSRTFALIALLGTLAASFGSWMLVAGFVVVGLLLLVSYWHSSRHDIGMTTELAAILAYVLGALAWERTGLAAGLAIVVTVILASKARLHAFVRDVVTEAEMEDALKFLVMAFVVLPLLPNRNVGPYGVLNPERIWQLVVALTGISWIGYVATRALGSRRGLLVAGLAGGFISATATTASMARLSRSSGHVVEAVSAASLASLATFAQLAGILAIADRALLDELWPALLGGALVLVVSSTTMVARRSSSDTTAGSNTGRSEPASTTGVDRPFGLGPTIVLAAVLTAALLLGRFVVDVVGPRAVLIAAGAAGFADAHAGVLSVATLHDQADIGMNSALWGVGAAVTTNLVVKCVLAFTAGGRAFGWRFAATVVPAFAVFTGAIGVIAAAQ